MLVKIESFLMQCSLVFALGLFAASMAQAAKPIESYIAPPAQFPAESNYGSRTPSPLAAYDKPRGTLMGHIRLENPKCLAMTDPQKEVAGCEFPLTFTYKAMGAPTLHKVELAEWSYETMGMTSYSPSVKDADYAWSQVQHAAGVVWVKTKKEDVHPYEDVAYLVPSILELCLLPGEQCRSVDAGVTKEMQRVTALVETCFDSPYSVVDRVTKNGKRYYKLSIENLGEGKSTSLPHVVYVPTRNPDGSHTGEFFSRGC